MIFCITNEKFCIKNEKLCTKNVCFTMMKFAAHHPGSGAQTLTIKEDGGLLRVTPRGVAFGEDT